MRRPDDAQRRLDSAGARAVKADRLKSRMRAAFRVLDGGGTIEEAAIAGKADHRTVKKWIAERKEKT